MSSQETLQYFDLRARAEAIRMLHSLADKPLNDVLIPRDDWPTVKGSKFCNTVSMFCMMPYESINQLNFHVCWMGRPTNEQFIVYFHCLVL